jgi:glutathione S-transferase
VVLPVSPWSERARWALDHHGLAYRTIEHVPFLGERRLRRLARSKPGERATVPVLRAGGQVLSDSWDIALYADREGRGSKLLPAGAEAEIRRWNDLAERTMMAGRAITVRALLASNAALVESLPPDVPLVLRRLLVPFTRYGTRWFARKYALDLHDTRTPHEALRAALDALRKAIAGSGYVLGQFGYADIVMATMLQGVVPVSDDYLPIGAATRQAFTLPELGAAYADVIAWRDGVYERHRREVPP